MRATRVLVTGGAGFIGRRVCRRLADEGRAVAIADSLYVGLPMPADERLLRREVDNRDKEGLGALMTEFKPDTVVHLAAIHHIPTCERERALALDVNIVGSETVLDLAERHGVESLVLASSGAVYDWTDGPLNETSSPLRPRDNYALCKSANETQVRFWAERTGARARLARIFNTIGHDDPNAHLVPDVLNQLHRARAEAVIQLGNLTPRRDYIHVDDTAEAIAAIAADPADQQLDIFNIGSGVEATVEALVQKIGREMGVKVRIEQDPARVRRVDRGSQLADVAHIRRRLGWSAKKDLDQTLAHIVGHFEFAA